MRILSILLLADHQEEWDRTAAEILADPTNGGSLVSGVRGRYQALGYCTTEFDMRGGPNDYGRTQYYKDQQGCDVKSAMWRRDDKGKLSMGHVEVVVEAHPDHVVTNSFGIVGRISGGSKGGFRFLRGDTDAVDKRGDLAYESEDTTLHAVVVCNCGVFENLGRKVLGQ